MKHDYIAEEINYRKRKISELEQELDKLLEKVKSTRYQIDGHEAVIDHLEWKDRK